MESANHPIPPLQAVFDGARRFGLTDAEVWQTFDDSMAEAGPDATISDYVHELTGELARRILNKQRRTSEARPGRPRSVGRPSGASG
jgi:hypothetical protein